MTTTQDNDITRCAGRREDNGKGRDCPLRAGCARYLLAELDKETHNGGRTYHWYCTPPKFWTDGLTHRCPDRLTISDINKRIPR